MFSIRRPLIEPNCARKDGETKEPRGVPSTSAGISVKEVCRVPLKRMSRLYPVLAFQKDIQPVTFARKSSCFAINRNGLATPNVATDPHSAPSILAPATNRVSLIMTWAAVPNECPNMPTFLVCSPRHGWTLLELCSKPGI